MVKPYCININLDKPRITFHYKGKDDKIIDEKTCLGFVENKIDEHMPAKTEIDKMVKKQIHAEKTKIETSLVIPETSKPKLLREFETKEGMTKVKMQIVNRLHSVIKQKLANTLLKENIDRAVNQGWLDDALQMIKG